MPHFDFDGAYEELLEHQKKILDESIKSDLDALKPDKMERSGKKVTLTWKKGDAAEIKKKLTDGLKAHKDKIKYLGADQDGAGVKAHVEMN
jgi:hypothetical protein